MKLATGIYIYLGVVASGILANFVLMQHRHHLYELNTDYSREPLHEYQMMLFGATLALIVAGFLLLACWKLFKRKN